MKMRILSFLTIFLFLSACKTEPSIEENSKDDITTKEQAVFQENTDEDLVEEKIEKEHNWIIYEGFIGMYQKHVVVTLSIADDNSVVGSYFYDKHQKHIDLAGTYDSKSGTYKLTESVKKKTTGLLEFKNFNGDLKGEWRTGPKDKDPQGIQLHLLYTAGTEKPTFTFSTYKMSHEITMYNGETEDLIKTTDILKIAEINADYKSFSYSLTRRNGHTGGADGVIRMDKNTKKQIGHFYGESNCDLEFEFNGKDVDIEEHDCEYYHGANAYMDGKLTLVK